MKIAIYQIVPEQDTNRVIFRNMEFVERKKRWTHSGRNLRMCLQRYSQCKYAGRCDLVFNIYHRLDTLGALSTASDVVEDHRG